MLEVILKPGAVCPACGTGEGRQKNIWPGGKMGRHCNECEAEWMCGTVNSRKAEQDITPTAPGGTLPSGTKPGGPRAHASGPRGNAHHCYQCGYDWGLVNDVVARTEPKLCSHCHSEHWQERVKRSGLDGKDGYCFVCRGPRKMVSSWVDYVNKRETLKGLCETCGGNMQRFQSKDHAVDAKGSAST